MEERFRISLKNYLWAVKRGRPIYRPDNFSEVQEPWAVYLRLVEKLSGDRHRSSFCLMGFSTPNPWKRGIAHARVLFSQMKENIMDSIMRKIRTFIAVTLACAATTLPACGSMGGGMTHLVEPPTLNWIT